MRFARIVFIVAGVWGIAVLTPLYFLVDVSGRQYAPPADYPHFFYGFVSVALVWQVAFLLIGTNPGRYRPLMIVAVFEKLGWIVTVAVMRAGGRISTLDASSGVPDALLGVLFIAAFLASGRSASRPGESVRRLDERAENRARAAGASVEGAPPAVNLRAVSGRWMCHGF